MKISIYFWLFNSIPLLWATARRDKVLFAINLGGVAHKGTDDVFYNTDSKKLATWSTYKPIAGATDLDQPLYNTQFSSPIHLLDLMLPVASHSRNYTLILKYVACTTSHLQNVTLNEQHLVVRNLNISKEAGGLYTAYDKSVDFRINTAGMLQWNNEQSQVLNNQIRLQAVGQPDTQLAALVLRFKDDGGVRNFLKKYWQKAVNTYRHGVMGSTSDDEL